MGNGRHGGRASPHSARGRDEWSPEARQAAQQSREHGGRKLRHDITPQERERLEKHGSLPTHKSSRNENRMSHGAVKPFIPSKEQH